MAAILEVSGLKKTYKNFELNNPASWRNMMSN